MVWAILLVKQKDNGWFLNYIKSKLLEQINKLNLQNNIEIIISDNLPVIFGNYISIIDEIIDISDNFIESVYNVLKNSTKDYIGLKGKIIIDDKTFIFNNLDYNDDEIFIPITKLNPIKKQIVLNIQNYFSYDNLTSFVKNSDNIDNIVVFKENIKKENISIIITAYKSQNFIEECLDSIINQSYFINNNNFEILVGVDGCAETYNKLNEIKHKYRNLNIYMMAENKGTYVTTNTLIDLTKFENILRFDSDDIMKPELVKEVFKHKKDNDLLMLGSVDLKDDKIGNEFLITPGIIFFKKSVMNIAGGYRPWLCAADSELISRLKDKIKISKINVALFYRRIHKNSLTSKPETGYGSTLRKEYIKQMNSYKGGIKIIKEVNKIVNKIENKSNLKIAFGMIVFNGDYVLKECLESIYPYATQILIAEGPVSYWQKKGYTISTDKTNEIIDNFPDPENKIKIIHSQYSEKDLQANAYMKLVNPDIDYIWHIDSDELFHSEDIEKIINALEKEKYTTVRFRAYSFFGGFDRFISGYESSLPYVRIKKYYPGSYWSTHRPPTLTHLVKNVLPEKPIDSSSIGVYMYHYSHVFPDQVYDKIQYYKEFLRPTKVIDNYFNKIYLPWVIGNDNEKLEIEKLYGIDENIKRPSKSEVFGGQHPKAIVDNFKKLKNKFETQLKKYNSIEFKLSLVKNTTSTTTVAPKTTTTTTLVTTTTTLVTTTTKNEEKIPISIIITAYQTQNYIEECLDSVENQTYFKDNDEFEVLVGIDACEDTLTKVKEIMHKYRNLRVFMMDSNMGTYVTSNTLLDLIKYENIIRFDSDDIMKPEMISTIVENIDVNTNLIKFKFLKNINNKIFENNDDFQYPHGVIYFKKYIIDNLGGYQSWKCAADSEFLERGRNIIKEKLINKPLFYRRYHKNSLTMSVEYGRNSKIRQKYSEMLNSFKEIKIVKIINKFKEIKLNKNLLIMITTYNRINFLKKTIETWYSTCNKHHNWTLIVADDGSTDGTLEYLYNLNLKDIKILIIENDNRGVHHQTNSMLKLALNIDFDYGFKIDDDLIFLKEGWDNIYVNVSNITGYYHLIYYDKKWGERRKERQKTIFKDLMLENSVKPENIQGAFWTFNKDVIKKVGYFDTNVYNLCGYGHVDYSLRCCRLGFNDINNPFDVIDSNSYITLNKEQYISHNNFKHFWNTNDIISIKKQNLFKERSHIEYNQLDSNLKNEKINIYDISFIIPLRGREDQIEGLEYNLNKIFNEYNYEIIYVNQNDNKLFKRGQLCNIGFKESRGDIIVFQDVDIRHLRKINIIELLNLYNNPFVAFDSITQLNEIKLGEYKIIETEKRPRGFGACAIFSREQFILSGGFSNLIIGWGIEDNIMNDRSNYIRLQQDLGHVYHIPSRKNSSIFNLNWYKNNKMLFQSDKERNKYKDGYIQTLYYNDIIQKSSNIKVINVNEIYIPDNYEYMDLYNKIKEEDL